MLDKHLETLLTPVVSALGYELLGIERISQGKRGLLLRVYIDHENGINIDDCEQVSHQISGVLDVEDPVSGQYTLEVSSPGLDRPLFTLAHFAQFCGSRVHVRLNRAIHGRRKFTGLIKAVDQAAAQVEIDVDNERYTLPYDTIDRAHLDPTNEDIQAFLKTKRN